MGDQSMYIRPMSHWKKLFYKPLMNAPKRLQKMLLRLQKYDVNVTYVVGHDILLADTLSRAYLLECPKGQRETET